MKKTVLVFALAFIATLTHAQEKDTQNKTEAAGNEFGYGILVNPDGTHYFNKQYNDTSFLLVMPCVNYLTKHSHSSIAYDIPSKTLALLNGYIFSPDKAIYVFASKSVIKNEYYASMGIEQGWDVIPHFDVTIFAEIGTNFNGVTSMSAGAMFSLHSSFNSLFKHKKK